MRLRTLIAGTTLSLALSACGGNTKDTAEPAVAATGAGDVAAPAAVTETTEETAATPSPTESASPTPSPTPVASGTPKPTATTAPPATPTATPAKVSAATPPASWNRCSVCHNAEKGAGDKLGPNLWGSYGKPMGQGSFAYSDALKNAGLTADDATLHKWLENPRALVPGNRMSFPGMKDAAKRQEIIDYLKQQR